MWLRFELEIEGVQYVVALPFAYVHLRVKIGKQNKDVKSGYIHYYSRILAKMFRQGKGRKSMGTTKNRNEPAKRHQFDPRK